jgi:hypothetical protein
VKSRIIAAVAYQFFFKYQASWEHCEVEDNCCCSGTVFLHQASWEHCDVEDNCFCSRTTFLNARLAGSIVTSRIIAAVAGLVF